MAIYVFKCVNEKCEQYNQLVELMHSMGSISTFKPKCKKCRRQLKRSYSNANIGVVYKTGGFHSTDYAKD